VLEGLEGCGMNVDRVLRNYFLPSWLTAVLLLSNCRSAGTEAPVAESGCYGFIRQGALVLNCSGQTQATPDLDVEGFAVSPDGNHLALMRSDSVPLDQYTSRQINESKLVDLRTRTTGEIQFYPDVVVGSCGKLFAFDDRRGMHDLIAGVWLSKRPYTIFRCSENEAVITGYTDTKKDGSHLGRKLLTGHPPTETISAFNHYLAFDVSPNGQYIAFSATRGHDGVVDRVCIKSNAQSPECKTDLPIIGPISVSNSGQILFEQHTEQECVYDDHFHFAPNVEKKDENLDACVGIFQWRVGQREPEALEPLGREPQWIPNAALLQEWMRQPIKF
jgi:hypothetical protein